MPTRMDRYNEFDIKKNYSRSEKNKDLYDNLGNNTRYTNITDVVNANAIDLTNLGQNINTREGYHQAKEYQQIEPIPKVKKELDDFNFLYKTRENRIYDVNRVLEEARKNYKDDGKEEKRRLKDNCYNIITSLDKEELENYRKKCQNKIRTPEEEELHGLIDTITSKTLAGEIDRATSVNLLSDLMATNILDKVSIAKKEKQEEDEPEDPKLELSRDVLDKEELKEIVKLHDQEKIIGTEDTNNQLSGADKDFYTRSMDLSDEDFEIDSEFQEKKVPLILKIFLILLVFVAIAVSAYFIWKNFS